MPSKSGQFNVHFGALPTYIPYRHSERNAAWAAKELLLHSPDRQGALFQNNAGAPLTQPFMKARLHYMVSSFMPVASVKNYSWHSFCSGFACMLLACKVKPSTIMAMLRWRSEESPRAYARLNPQEWSPLLDRAERACVASVQTSNLPITERFDLFLSLEPPNARADVDHNSRWECFWLKGSCGLPCLQGGSRPKLTLRTFCEHVCVVYKFSV